jgi:hypothetical protein
LAEEAILRERERERERERAHAERNGCKTVRQTSFSLNVMDNQVLSCHLYGLDFSRARKGTGCKGREGPSSCQGAAIPLVNGSCVESKLLLLYGLRK